MEQVFSREIDEALWFLTKEDAEEIAMLYEGGKVGKKLVGKKDFQLRITTDLLKVNTLYCVIVEGNKREYYTGNHPFAP
jgi:hypothetical protein